MNHKNNSELTWIESMEHEFSLAFAAFIVFYKERNGGFFKPKNVSKNENEKNKTIIKSYALETVKITMDDDAFATQENLQKNLRNVFFYHDKKLQGVAKAQLIQEQSESVEPMQITLFEQQPVEQVGPIDTTSEAYQYYSNLRTPSGDLLSPKTVEQLVRFQFSDTVRKRVINYGMVG